MLENLEEPQSRTEEILQNALGEEYDVTPQSRVEQILDDMVDGEKTDVIPRSRVEELLLKLSESGGGGGGSGLEFEVGEYIVSEYTNYETSEIVFSNSHDTPPFMYFIVDADAALGNNPNIIYGAINCKALTGNTMYNNECIGVLFNAYSHGDTSSKGTVYYQLYRIDTDDTYLLKCSKEKLMHFGVSGCYWVKNHRYYWIAVWPPKA